MTNTQLVRACTRTGRAIISSSRNHQNNNNNNMLPPPLLSHPISSQSFYSSSSTTTTNFHNISSMTKYSNNNNNKNNISMNNILTIQNSIQRTFVTTTPIPSSSSSSRVDAIFQKILHLDTVEVNLLTELVNEKIGMKPLTAAQRDAMARSGRSTSNNTGSDDEDTTNTTKEEEKTTFDLKLNAYDDKSKIKVIKEVRAITGLGLKEAKEVVEGIPKIIKKDIKLAEAEELKVKLEAVGATVEIV